MAKAANKEKGLARRVSAIERKVAALSRETPVFPEQLANAQAAMGQQEDVAQTMARLGGQSTAGLTPDAVRGAASPLGTRKGRR